MRLGGKKRKRRRLLVEEKVKCICQMFFLSDSNMGAVAFSGNHSGNTIK